MTRVAKEFILKHNWPLLRATEMHGERRSFIFFTVCEETTAAVEKKLENNKKSTGDTRNGNTRKANETNATPPLAEEACRKNLGVCLSPRLANTLRKLVLCTGKQ